MTSLSPWTAIRCMWLRSQAHRGKPRGHACRTSPRSVSSRRFAGFAQKAATHRCNGLDVPTFCHYHHATAPPPYTSRVAPTSYRKKIPQITCRTCTVHVRVLGRRAILRHAHGHAYAAGGRRVSTSTYPRRKRCRHPRPHCALGASASSDPGTLYETAGSITSHRPSSDPPSYSERFDARLLRSVHHPHDQRNTQAAPPKAEAPPYETYSPKGGTMGVVWKAAQRATVATFAERGTFHG